MKDWITIGQLAKKTGLTARAIRFYETKGLLKSHMRGENDYRFYSKKELALALQIKEFRDIGFTLNEISELLVQDPSLTTKKIQLFLLKKIESLQVEQNINTARISKIKTLITSFNNSHKLSETQRRLIMKELLLKAKEKIKERGINPSHDLDELLALELTQAEHQNFLKKFEILDLIKDVADQMNIKIGPGRGSAAASLMLYSKGFNHNTSKKFNLLPDLFYHSINPMIWIDIEFNAGPDFLNELLKKISLQELKESNIFIFQCPFLTVISDVEKQVGTIAIENIKDDDNLILQNFNKNDLQNIFLFDNPEKSIMHSNANLNFWKEEKELKKVLLEHLKKYKVQGPVDILNLATLGFPIGNKKSMLDLYINSANMVEGAKSLPLEIQNILKDTKGLLIYREDYIRILKCYLDWTISECNQFYMYKLKRLKQFNKVSEYDARVPEHIKTLLEQEVNYIFLKSHMVCMWWFIKYSAVLNSMYPKQYQIALNNWKSNHHSAWSDLGFIDKDYRPLALYF